jgi:hypothetical protein
MNGAGFLRSKSRPLCYNQVKSIPRECEPLRQGSKPSLRVYQCLNAAKIGHGNADVGDPTFALGLDVGQLDIKIQQHF